MQTKPTPISMRLICVIVVFSIVQYCRAMPASDVSIPTPESCKRRPVAIRISFNNCETKRRVVFACKGTCPSYSQMSSGGETIDRSCKCCKEKGEIEHRVKLRCRNRETRRLQIVQVKMKVPLDCMCRPCSNLLNPTQALQFGGEGTSAGAMRMRTAAKRSLSLPPPPASGFYDRYSSDYGNIGDDLEDDVIDDYPDRDLIVSKRRLRFD
ncbi:bursicon-like [Tubulanus polymorphus]|uniref:bursicon-like n=1 Tax=Tubulanus polymorphus TaxID=672921 RepID=UPI003DA3DA7A